ncbi:MAG: RagB/SusD family nutrient uptake outer membrane protein [Prevotella sp.]|nr:RagB/SusD family nutrient uptake outer membrane protein [Candidatus Equicola stercoris]
MKKIFRNTVLLAVTFMLAACDFTDLQPINNVGTAAAFSSVSSLEKVVVSSYARLNYLTYLHQSEWGADNVKIGGQSGGNGATTMAFGWTSTSGDYSSIWSGSYTAIAELNRLFTNCENIEVGPDETARYNQAVGEAHFLRAWHYYELLRFFSDFEKDSAAGVPIVTTEIVLEQPERNTVGECYTFIIDELNTALSLLSQDKAKLGYASKAAVYGLLARLYYYRNDFSNAKSFAEKAIAGSQLGGDGVTPMDNWAEIWTDEYAENDIFTIIKKSGETTLGTMFFTADNACITEASLKASTMMADVNDVRGTVTIIDAPDRDKNTVKRVVKFEGLNWKTSMTNCGLCNWKMIRTEEMRMIAIEATAQTDVAAAAKMLNDFQAQRYVEFTPKTYATKDDLIKAIIDERDREFMYEGIRWWDGRHYKLDMLCGSDLVTVRAADSYKWIMPIPDAELQSNFNIEQNPGY